MNTTKTITLLLCVATLSAAAQTDSIRMKIGNKSSVNVTIGDRQDISLMKKYDFQKLMHDMLTHVETRDTTALPPSSHYLKQSGEVPASADKDSVFFSIKKSDVHAWKERKKRNEKKFHNHDFLRFDVGLNNYSANGSTPTGSDLSAVKAWGSWTIGVYTNYRVRPTNNFLFDLGLGAHWDNYKFQNPATVLSQQSDRLQFMTDTRTNLNFNKSKLTAFYLDAFLLPTINFKKGVKNFDDDGFRLAVGPFVSYKLDSYTKQVYHENGSKHRERFHNNYYLNNWQYGIRVQVGIGGLDIFMKYALNDLFQTQNAPALQAYSFGITF